MDDLSDTQLIQQTLSGDDKAFETLVKRYQQGVFRWVWKILPDKQYDQDLVQEVFVEAYFNLDTLREPEKFKGWLKKIARNVCVSWIRRQRRAFSHEQFIEKKGMHEWVEVWSSQSVPTPEAILSYKEDLAELKATVHRLSEVHQEVVQLYYFEGLSYQEISALLDISESAIKSRLHRAREKLKGVFNDE